MCERSITTKLFCQTEALENGNATFNLTIAELLFFCWSTKCCCISWRSDGFLRITLPKLWKLGGSGVTNCAKWMLFCSHVLVYEVYEDSCVLFKNTNEEDVIVILIRTLELSSLMHHSVMAHTSFFLSIIFLEMKYFQQHLIVLQIKDPLVLIFIRSCNIFMF